MPENCIMEVLISAYIGAKFLIKALGKIFFVSNNFLIFI